MGICVCVFFFGMPYEETAGCLDASGNSHESGTGI